MSIQLDGYRRPTETPLSRMCFSKFFHIRVELILNSGPAARGAQAGFGGSRRPCSLASAGRHSMSPSPGVGAKADK